jgi:hypothetical protein
MKLRAAGKQEEDVELVRVDQRSRYCCYNSCSLALD